MSWLIEICSRREVETGLFSKRRRRRVLVERRTNTVTNTNPTRIPEPGAPKPAGRAFRVRADGGSKLSAQPHGGDQRSSAPWFFLPHLMRFFFFRQKNDTLQNPMLTPSTLTGQVLNANEPLTCSRIPKSKKTLAEKHGGTTCVLRKASSTITDGLFPFQPQMSPIIRTVAELGCPRGRLLSVHSQSSCLLCSRIP